MIAAAAMNERRSYALALRLLAISAFAVMGALVKLLSDRGVSLPEVVFWRQAMALPIIMLVLWYGPGLGSVRTSRFGAHAKRTVIGLTCIGMSFGSIVTLPLAESTTLGFAVPIFATLLGLIVFQEKVGARRMAAVLMGFVGVLIVAQPSTTQLDPVGTAYGLTAALLIALVSFHIRDLGRTEAPTTTVFWFTMLSTLIMVGFLPFFWQSHDITTWLMMLAMGSLGGAAQFGMVTSLRYAPVSVVVGMDYIALIWAAFFGWLIWNQIPTLTTWLGAAVIIASGLYIALREHKLAIQRAKDVTA